MYALGDFLFGVLQAFGVFSTALGRMAGARQIFGDYAIAGARSVASCDARAGDFTLTMMHKRGTKPCMPLTGTAALRAHDTADGQAILQQAGQR
jgi:hypothetical protein